MVLEMRWEGGRKRKSSQLSQYGTLRRKHQQVMLARSLNPVVGTVHETVRGKFWSGCRWRSGLWYSNNGGDIYGGKGGKGETQKVWFLWKRVTRQTSRITVRMGPPSEETI